MKISLSGIKAKVVGKCVGGATVGMAAMIGMTPMTAFAGGAETVCICEKKCTEDEINKDCEICSYDYTYCDGKEEKEEEHWGPLTPDGNMNLVDDYGSIEAGGKQFITVTTKAGNFFYIIIDRDDQGQETVHFLNLVDESDLLALMDDEEVEKYMESTGMVTAPEEVPQTPVVDEPVEEEPTEVVEEPEKKSTNVNGIMAIVLVIAIAGIGGFFYFKSTKGKKSKPTGPDPDEDYSEDIDFLDDDEDEEYGIDDEDIAVESTDDSDSKGEGDDE